MKDNLVIPPKPRDNVTLSLVNGTGARILIPPQLRPEILETLHAAHQGVGGMRERAKTGVYWPGITKDIKSLCANCNVCNKVTPSHAHMSPLEPCIPSTLFKAFACDYFDFKGYHYFAAADRLSIVCPPLSKGGEPKF